ncbi:hypothetical protein LGN24_25505 [Burkholderia seminalis]|nr:hypothetical protein [Burkholderia seminalis]MCA8304845.1 hypothetical protein [Burkholderia seminalis]MCA8430178.1 hypothetical protein [Burkholderia seminalis]VWB12421.1 peptidase [Burkholderia seminalis]
MRHWPPSAAIWKMHRRRSRRGRGPCWPGGARWIATSIRRFVVVPGATHGLPRAGWFDYPLESDWPRWKIGPYTALGRHVYAPGTLGPIEAWIRSQ